jgi:hypothetical protein
MAATHISAVAASNPSGIMARLRRHWTKYQTWFTLLRLILLSQT